jgi:hypothetical protein
VVVVVSRGALRYVVLRHDGIEDPHYDLMFEITPGGPLATWRANGWPVSSGDYVVRLPDHRNTYLDYEGPVSGDRGTVRRVATGTCDVSLADGLFQAKLSGGPELTVVKDSPAQWLCVVAGEWR